MLLRNFIRRTQLLLDRARYESAGMMAGSVRTEHSVDAAPLEERILMSASPLAVVADAAEAGKEASKDMIATMGRAKTLGERSLGKADAGACSVAIITATMRDFVA